MIERVFRRGAAPFAPACHTPTNVVLPREKAAWIRQTLHGRARPGAAGDAAEREGLTDLPGKVTAVAERAREAAKDKGRQQSDQMKKQTERL